MSISEQVKELREIADSYIYGWNGKRILNQAADTIETLSAELRDMCKAGEWIYCAERDDFPEESGEYQTVYDGQEVFAKLNFDTSDGTWFDNKGEYRKVIAWWRDYPYEP